MYQKLCNLQKQKVVVLQKYYDGEIDRLRRQCREALEHSRLELKVRIEGWHAFEDRQSVHQNPYVFGDRPDMSNLWNEGWEMGREEREYVKK